MRYLILFLFPSVCFAGDWTTTDTAWQAAYTTALALDCAQTRYIATHHGHFHEENPAVGTYPSKGLVDNICLGSAIGNTIVSYILPSEWRRAWQVGSTAVEVTFVLHNRAIGLKMEF